MSDDITLKARGVACTLTYNDDAPQAAAKHLLLELAHRIDRTDVRAHRKADGLLLVDALGKARFATWRERAAYWLAGTLPRTL